MHGSKGIIQSAMHFVDGLIVQSQGEDGKPCGIEAILKTWDKGCCELYDHLAQYAPLCHQLYEEGYAKSDCGAPGVYDYEVSCEFGEWFGTQLVTTGGAPSHEECEAKLRELADAFWKQMEGTP